MARRRRDTALPPPFLKRVWLPEREEQEGPDEVDWDRYPFNLPMIGNSGIDIAFDSPITIIVGENGSGKSTILEAIAHACGFSDKGGAQQMGAVSQSIAHDTDGGALGELLKTSWLPQVRNGWFFRAETFFDVARYLDEASIESGKTPPQFLKASHGQGFLGFFEERLNNQGIYFFDEPESALSPMRQFDFLKILRRMQREGKTQVIMATHSPILMALPDAALWDISRFGLQPITLEDTEHFRIYREFMLYPHDTVEAMIE
ncbi:AAA family ATPase [Erythrobacter ani]|uniref:AAA family ATPase n=1 Tax=Erythrobacter ani TaxID=2827235 RepID=A0ABS6SJU5_9SPHN|nr:AAA family ATPase [Erythrobacter ani]MBV7265288.1 AAA family ATPase [Erythrobacter ani]